MTDTQPAPEPVPAPDPAILEQARANVAARHRAIADATEAGEYDFTWGVRHEIAKLEAQR